MMVVTGQFEFQKLAVAGNGMISFLLKVVFFETASGV